jgi:hypothetical protein
MNRNRTRKGTGSPFRFYVASDEDAQARKTVAALRGEIPPLTVPPAGELAERMADEFTQFVQVMEAGAPGRPSVYAAYLRAGAWFAGYHEPDDWPDDLKGYAARRPPQVQQCFYNSLMAGLGGPARELGLSYFEGIVYLPRCPFPIEHAWLGAAPATGPAGVAVDLTFPAADRDDRTKDPNFRKGAVYCGLSVPWGFLARVTVAEEHARPRLAGWLATAIAHCGG